MTISARQQHLLCGPPISASDISDAIYCDPADLIFDPFDRRRCHYHHFPELRLQRRNCLRALFQVAMLRKHGHNVMLSLETFASQFGVTLDYARGFCYTFAAVECRDEIIAEYAAGYADGLAARGEFAFYF